MLETGNQPKAEAGIQPLNLTLAGTSLMPASPAHKHITDYQNGKYSVFTGSLL